MDLEDQRGYNEKRQKILEKELDTENEKIQQKQVELQIKEFARAQDEEHRQLEERKKQQQEWDKINNFHHGDYDEGGIGVSTEQLEIKNISKT